MGERIRELRDREALTIEELAARSGMSKGFISEIENDKRKPGADYLLRLANTLGASLDYLMRGEAEETAVTRPVMIPHELSVLAEELDLSYPETLEVLAAHNSVVARRSRRGVRKFTVEDWRRLHDAIRQVYDGGD
ncbi:MAG: helix-turn-helix domain-containing protein [Acidobacteria bacterium]|nr:helix-turn-helix domain-containing protein [Acidobacteriota bacterium]